MRNEKSQIFSILAKMSSRGNIWDYQGLFFSILVFALYLISLLYNKETIDIKEILFMMLLSYRRLNPEWTHTETVPSAQHWCSGGWCWSCVPGKHTAL